MNICIQLSNGRTSGELTTGQEFKEENYYNNYPNTNSQDDYYRSKVFQKDFDSQRKNNRLSLNDIRLQMKEWTLSDLENQSSNYFEYCTSCTPIMKEDYQTRAQCFYYLKQYESAIKDISKFIEFEPNDPYGYENRAEFYKLTGQHKHALDDANTYLKLTPYPSYIQRAQIKLLLKDFEGALADCDLEIQLDPNYYYAYYLKWEIYNKINNKTSALKNLLQAQKLAPNEKDVKDALKIEGIDN